MKRGICLIISILFIINMHQNPLQFIGTSSSSQNVKASIGRTKKNNSIDIPVNNSLLNQQWMINYTKSNEAWRLINSQREVKVAVVDSGVDYNNPELKDRVLKNKGYNFVSNTNNVMDDMGHGTEVAGIIAAEQENKTGISGIAGPANVKIIPVKVLNNKGLGDSQTIAKGIVYSVDQGADIINVSIDFDTHDRYIEDALNYASYYGVLVVVAAGNSNSVCDDYSPAGDIGAYTVAAVTEKGDKAAFSSFGRSVSIAAPGVNILTTSIGGKYTSDSGTSMSAPIIAGVAAMIKAENYLLKAKDIEQIINSTAIDVQRKGKDVASGYGVVNAYRALLAAEK